MHAPPLELVGRDAEAARITSLLAERDEGARAVVLRGEPGIGKTAVWRWGVEAAVEAGWRVLVTRCAEVEIPLALGGLVDLLDAPFGEIADELPAPQRLALAVALGLEEPLEPPAEPLTLARAAVQAFRVLSAHAPVVVAIDDVQWLDPASQRVLAFALRRLADTPVALLATLRADAGRGEPLALSDALGPAGFTEIELAGLTQGALRHLLHTRLKMHLPRSLLARVHRTSGGNPMFALELARMPAAHVELAGGPLPFPESLEQLVGERLTALPQELIPLLRLIAILERPTLAQLARALASEADARRLVDVGFAHAVLDLAADGVVRFAHPLLASAVYAGIRPQERQKLQYHAAEVTEDGEERARHLALAVSAPDAGVAARLDAAAARAAARGAPEAAAELAVHALRLTALDADRVRRGLAYATYLVAANRPGPRGASLPPEAANELDDLLAREVADDDRARILLLRSLFDLEHEACVRRLREASAHARDPSVRARTSTMLAWTLGVWGWELDAAAQEAERAVEVAASADGKLLQVAALTALGTIHHHHGLPGALAHLERALELQGEAGSAEADAALALGLARVARGEFGSARTLFDASRERAHHAGEDAFLMWLHRFVGELELRSGRWDAAEHEIEAGLTEAADHWRATLVCLRALLAARRGEAVEAMSDASEAHAYGAANGDPRLVVGAAWARGSLALVQEAPEAAYEQLAAGQTILDEAGIGEPGLLPLSFELVEAAAATGNFAHGEQLAGWLDERAVTLDHPWARAAAARSRGIVELGAGEPRDALSLLERAGAGFAALGAPYELAHTQRTLGAAYARLGERRNAAEALQEAHRIFGDLGTLSWQERTERELRRAYPRPRRDHELTPAEEHVAALVASGRTNREVAAQLFTTVKTVETHLTRIYRKTGVRSRTELARRSADAHLD